MKQIFSSGKLQIGNQIFGVTSFQVMDKHGEIDATDVASSGFKEYAASIQGVNFSIELFARASTQLKSGQIYANSILDCQTHAFFGDLIIFNIATVATIDAAVKYKLDGQFTGNIEVLVSQLMRNSNGINQTAWIGANPPYNWVEVGGSFDALATLTDECGTYLYMEIDSTPGVTLEQTFSAPLTNGVLHRWRIVYGDLVLPSGSIQFELEGGSVQELLSGLYEGSGITIATGVVIPTNNVVKFVINNDAETFDAFNLRLYSIDLFKAI